MGRKLIRRKPSPKRMKSSKAKVEEETTPKKVTRKVSLAELESMARELSELNMRGKQIDDRKKELKDRLGIALESMAYKDSKGSYITKVTVDGVEKVLKKEARKKPALNLEKAEELFRKKKVWDFVTEKKEIINTDYVEQAVNQGKLTAKDIEQVTEISVNYAIIVKDYKPEEEEEGIL